MDNKEYVGFVREDEMERWLSFSDEQREYFIEEFKKYSNSESLTDLIVNITRFGE